MKKKLIFLVFFKLFFSITAHSEQVHIAVGDLKKTARNVRRIIFVMGQNYLKANELIQEDQTVSCSKYFQTQRTLFSNSHRALSKLAAQLSEPSGLNLDSEIGRLLLLQDLNSSIYQLSLAQLESGNKIKPCKFKSREAWIDNLRVNVELIDEVLGQVTGSTSQEAAVAILNQYESKKISYKLHDFTRSQIINGIAGFTSFTTVRVWLRYAVLAGLALNVESDFLRKFDITDYSYLGSAQEQLGVEFVAKATEIKSIDGKVEQYLEVTKDLAKASHMTDLQIDYLKEILKNLNNPKVAHPPGLEPGTL